jgi:hypothetical protein
MPKWLKALAEHLRFWQTWFISVPTSIVTAWQAFAAVAGAYFVIQVFALVGTKLGEGLKAMNVATRLEGMDQTGHGPAKLQAVIQLWTGIDDPRISESARVDWQIALRQFKQCADKGCFTFSNSVNDAQHPGAYLDSQCDLPTTAKFFRRLAWKGVLLERFGMALCCISGRTGQAFGSSN